MWYLSIVFIFNDTETPEIYTYVHTLSLHGALPIYAQKRRGAMDVVLERLRRLPGAAVSAVAAGTGRPAQSLNIRQSIAELFEDRRSMLVAEAGKARAEQIGRAHV